MCLSIRNSPTVQLKKHACRKSLLGTSSKLDPSMNQGISFRYYLSIYFLVPRSICALPVAYNASYSYSIHLIHDACYNQFFFHFMALIMLGKYQKLRITTIHMFNFIISFLISVRFKYCPRNCVWGRSVFLFLYLPPYQLTASLNNT